MQRRPTPSEPTDPKQGGVTRRALFKGAGAAAAAAAISRGTEALAREPTQAPLLGPEAIAVSTTINGTASSLRVEARTTLLDALRMQQGLTGAKPVCERSQCGACTVHLDGLPVYACGVLALEVEGRDVRTVEGLGAIDAMHPVQQAFCQEDAVQCGFCTPGMVMSCAWAVARHGKDLSQEQARAATSGNLCRCGTHPHVLRAALRAAKGV